MNKIFYSSTKLFLKVLLDSFPTLPEVRNRSAKIFLGNPLDRRKIIQNLVGKMYQIVRNEVMVIAIVIATSVPIIQFRNRSFWNHANADENGIFLQLEFDGTNFKISAVNLNDVAVKRILEILRKNQVVDGSVHDVVVGDAYLDY
ncbi:hypothetical protein [Bandra megavirus]|uniref:Uncharacterized protein n=2 Tax=Megamimivirinae TaxID=3044648 RepID=A0A2L2DL83_MIMIV|nr:hypothetical protein [Bandra megavirus]AVG46921.1 hypothetical protein [Acanthamoeba polyphaga mimivirus]